MANDPEGRQLVTFTVTSRNRRAVAGAENVQVRRTALLDIAWVEGEPRQPWQYMSGRGVRPDWRPSGSFEVPVLEGPMQSEFSVQMPADYARGHLVVRIVGGRTLDVDLENNVQTYAFPRRPYDLASGFETPSVDYRCQYDSFVYIGRERIAPAFIEQMNRWGQYPFYYAYCEPVRLHVDFRNEGPSDSPPDCRVRGVNGRTGQHLGDEVLPPLAPGESARVSFPFDTGVSIRQAALMTFRARYDLDCPEEIAASYVDVNPANDTVSPCVLQFAEAFEQGNNGWMCSGENLTGDGAMAVFDPERRYRGRYSNEDGGFILSERPPDYATNPAPGCYYASCNGGAALARGRPSGESAQALEVYSANAAEVEPDEGGEIRDGVNPLAGRDGRPELEGGVLEGGVDNMRLPGEADMDLPDDDSGIPERRNPRSGGQQKSAPAPGDGTWSKAEITGLRILRIRSLDADGALPFDVEDVTEKISPDGIRASQSDDGDDDDGGSVTCSTPVMFPTGGSYTLLSVYLSIESGTCVLHGDPARATDILRFESNSVSSITATGVNGYGFSTPTLIAGVGSFFANGAETLTRAGHPTYALEISVETDPGSVSLFDYRVRIDSFGVSP